MFSRPRSGDRQSRSRDRDRHAAFVHSYFERHALTEDADGPIPSRLLQGAEHDRALDEASPQRIDRLESREIDEESLAAIPHGLLRRQWILPLRADDGELEVATGHPLAREAREALHH